MPVVVYLGYAMVATGGTLLCLKLAFDLLGW